MRQISMVLGDSTAKIQSSSPCIVRIGIEDSRMTSRSVSQTPHTPQRRINPWLVRLPLLFITGSILLAVTLAAFLVAFQVRHTERVLPGISAMGVDLGGMSQGEAMAALADSFAYENDAVFTFRDGERIWQLSAGELGLAFDAEATADAAFNAGRAADPVNMLSNQADVWFNGRGVSPVITYDQNVAFNTLQTIAQEVNISAVDATLSLDGTIVNTTEGQIGRALDVSATLRELNDALLRLEAGGEIPLVITETQPMVMSVAETASKIERAFSGPVRLVASDQTGAQLGPWTVTVEQIAQLLSVTQMNSADGSQSYEVDIDMGAFETFLAQLAPGLITPALDGRFDFDPATGQLQVLTPAVSGRELDVATTLARLEEGVFAPDSRIVPMAFDYTLPRYHNQVTAAELGITELVAAEVTHFEGSSANRRTNIAVGVSRLNGIIVGPGEEFSFNYHLGEIDESNGFVEGLVIFGGRTIAGLGGGICQVSTTIFRAAFSGGFAITERNSHGYRVGYYELQGDPPGLDAAIWQPERDFKFQNNTPHHLLVEASFYPSRNELEFRFYSTQHWRAEIDDAIVKNLVDAPQPIFEANRDLQQGEILQVDFAAEGADVTVYRDIYDMQGNLVVEDDYVFTHYVPWQAIYQVAPTDSRLSTVNTVSAPTG